MGNVWSGTDQNGLYWGIDTVVSLFFEHLYSFILIWNYCNEVMIHYNVFICIVFLLKPANQCENIIMTRPASHVLLVGCLDTDE